MNIFWKTIVRFSIVFLFFSSGCKKADNADVDNLQQIVLTNDIHLHLVYELENFISENTARLISLKAQGEGSQRIQVANWTLLKSQEIFSQTANSYNQICAVINAGIKPDADLYHNKDSISFHSLPVNISTSYSYDDWNSILLKFRSQLLQITFDQQQFSENAKPNLKSEESEKARKRVVHLLEVGLNESDWDQFSALEQYEILKIIQTKILRASIFCNKYLQQQTMKNYMNTDFLPVRINYDDTGKTVDFLVGYDVMVVSNAIIDYEVFDRSTNKLMLQKIDTLHNQNSLSLKFDKGSYKIKGKCFLLVKDNYHSHGFPFEQNFQVKK